MFGFYFAPDLKISLINIIFFLPLSLSWCAVSERSISCWLQTSLPGVRKECTVLYVMFTMHHLFCCLFYVTYILNSIYELYIPLQSWSIQFLTKTGRCTRFLLSTSTFLRAICSCCVRVLLNLQELSNHTLHTGTSYLISDIMLLPCCCHVA